MFFEKFDRFACLTRWCFPTQTITPAALGLALVGFLSDPVLSNTTEVQDDPNNLAIDIINRCQITSQPVQCALRFLDTDNTEATTVFSAWSEACGNDDALACAYLGTLFQSGRVVERNHERAADLYKKACDAGVPMGCGQLGALHLHGKGVEPNENEAARLILLACEDGYFDGCMNRGLLFENGIGVPLDLQHAASIYEEHCAQNMGLACVNLGGLYNRIEDDDVVNPLAASLFLKACKLGAVEGCSGYGLMLLTQDNSAQAAQEALEFLV